MLQFHCVLSVKGKVKRTFTVGAARQMVYGVTWGRLPYAPYKPDLIAALPAQYRKAAERSGGFWFDKYDSDSVPCYLELQGVRHNVIARVTCTALRSKEESV